MKKILLIFSFSFSLLFALSANDAFEKSYAYEKSFKYSDAIKVLMPIYKQNKNAYFINLRLGWLFALNKDYPSAIKHYKKALITKPNSIEAHLGLIKSYLALQQLDNAIRTANIILKTDKFNYYGNYYLILALIQKKEYNQALKLSKKMLSLYPSDLLYLEQLAKIYAIVSPAEAIKVYRYILIINPNSISAKNYLNRYKYHIRVY